jgi:hypothetical protein
MTRIYDARELLLAPDMIHIRVEPVRVFWQHDELSKRYIRAFKIGG